MYVGFCGSLILGNLFIILLFPIKKALARPPKNDDLTRALQKGGATLCCFLTKNIPLGGTNHNKKTLFMTCSEILRHTLQTFTVSPPSNIFEQLPGSNAPDQCCYYSTVETVYRTICSFVNEKSNKTFIKEE